MKHVKRIKEIIHANVHAKLQRMEDPQKMVSYLLSEMEQTISNAKSSATEKHAQCRIIEEEVKEAQNRVKRWERRSLAAVEKGRDELAREALAEKNRAQRAQMALEEELTQMRSIALAMNTHIDELIAKRDEMRDKQRLLVQRASYAKQKKAIVKVLKDLETSSVSQAFNELEEKIELLESEAQMAGFSPKSQHTEKEFSQMEQDEAIEQELLRLKTIAKSQTGTTT